MTCGKSPGIPLTVDGHQAAPDLPGLGLRLVMIALHLSLLDGAPALWAEDGAAPPALRAGRDHPFALAPERRADLLRAAGVPGVGRPAPAHAWAWLPTAAGRPLPSSGLLATAPGGAPDAPALARWRLSTLHLADAHAFLVAADGARVLAPGVLVGDDLAFWARAFRFAAALVARESFLPGLSPAPEGWRARWEPVCAGPDADRLARLAEAMPPACRALALSPDRPPETAPLAVLRDALAGFVDGLVRAAVAVPAGKATHDSVHDRWMAALRTPAPAVLDDNGDDLGALAGAIAVWRRRLDAAAGAPFRLTFRLDEPDGDPEVWTVAMLLQAADDPSLLLDAADAWEPDEATAAHFARRGAEPRATLLAALGQAMDLFPALEASLVQGAPGGVALDTAAAHHFLTETAWRLQQAGFGVRLPGWWARRGGHRLSATASVRSPAMTAPGGLSLSRVVDVDWGAALGGEPLTAAELEALADLKTPLVQMRGQWVEVDAEAIRAALAFWRTKPTLTVRDAVRLALGLDGAAGLPVEAVAATGWMGEVLERLGDADRVEPLAAPDGFAGTLRPYQARGAGWLAFLQQWGLGACLADDMGLGKTIQTLALVQQNKEAGSKKGVLLVCPTSVLGNWQREAARFTPGLNVLVHHGTKRATTPDAFKAEAKRHDLVLTSYALLHRDEALLKGVRWQALVLDEAQNVKNANTKQALAARAIPAEHRIALTGTPVENHVGDLWALMDLLNPGLLGTKAAFKRDFFAPIQNAADGDEAQAGARDAAQRLRRITGPFVLRRLKTDRTIIDDLPEKLEMEVFTTLTREQASLYRAVVKEAEAALDGAEGIQRKGLVLSTLTRLKQVCNHPAHLLHDGSAVSGADGSDRSGKLARLTEMIAEVVASGERALLFTQFTEMGEIVRQHLQATFGREALFLHGGVPRVARDRMVERFQTDPDGPPFFLLSLKAGGTGLTLTRASHVFHIDRWWNPAVENQATDRAFRIGQTRQVQVHKFVCIGTVEERIHEMLARKKAVAEQVVGTGEDWLTELSTRDLKALFRLRPEAVRD